MMNTWHLLWLLPAAAFFGFSIGAWLATGKECDAQVEHEQGGAWPGEDKCAECPFNPHKGGADNG